MSRGWGRFPPYVPVAKGKQQAAREIAALKKKGLRVKPVVIEGRTIAKTFWGKAWCEHLESYSDYENRLPRGRTYVRNGSVMDLQITPGTIQALVSGSSIYKVSIAISKVKSDQWSNLVKACSGKIDSLIDLLLGQLSKGMMGIITHPKNGLFPTPKEIKLNCSCPDWATMCKHVAAVLYGVGSRLDTEPEALFMLRQADHSKLITTVQTGSLLKRSMKKASADFSDSDLSSIFGIAIEQDPSTQKKRTSLKQRRSTVPIKTISKSTQKASLLKKATKPSKAQAPTKPVKSKKPTSKSKNSPVSKPKKTKSPVKTTLKKVSTSNANTKKSKPTK